MRQTTTMAALCFNLILAQSDGTEPSVCVWCVVCSFCLVLVLVCDCAAVAEGFRLYNYLLLYNYQIFQKHNHKSQVITRKPIHFQIDVSISHHMIMSVKTIVVLSSGILKCRGGLVLQSRFYVSLQLPLVLDNHSNGIDIRLWVRVISATSDKLQEVSHCSCSPAPKVHHLLFSAVRKQLLPLA